jgi:type VI protein secretion system component VasK
VPIAADYPFSDVFWSMIIFFVWVIWVLIDVFRRHDIGGFAKALWLIFVVVLPWLGVLIYLIAEHDGMRERSAKQAQAQQDQFDEYVRETAGRVGRRDRQGQGTARLRNDHPGGVRRDQGKGCLIGRRTPPVSRRLRDRLRGSACGAGRRRRGLAAAAASR